MFSVPSICTLSNKANFQDMIKRIKIICCFFALISIITSCNTSKEIVYLQDIQTGTKEKVDSSHGIVIQPKDMLSIIVSSKDPQLASMFNLPVVSYQAGSEIVSGGQQQRLLGYVVDEKGFINFPILGKIEAAGYTRWQLQEKIKKEIISRDLLKDLVVTVEFMNFKISILGEVTNPGSYKIEGDKVTILEALSMAKDLTIFGRRDQVYVIREENNTRTTYQVDLRSTDLFNSPVYYLKQNDIVYVQPNKVKAGQSTINENNIKSVGLWISIASLLSSVGVLIVNLLN